MFYNVVSVSKSFEYFDNVNRSMDTMSLFQKALHGLKMLRFALPFIPHIRHSEDSGSDSEESC